MFTPIAELFVSEMFSRGQVFGIILEGKFFFENNNGNFLDSTIGVEFLSI